jgi:hypothetical protein
VPQATVHTAYHFGKKKKNTKAIHCLGKLLEIEKKDGEARIVLMWLRKGTSGEGL